MADLQAEIQAAAGEMVAAGTETGLQIAVHRHGRVVADVVSGIEDPGTGTPVTPGTLFYAASTAKGVAASLAHVLAERGDITYDLRLADVWPQFAARGAARMYSAMLGHVQGVKLVSGRRRGEMAAVAFTGMDEVMGFPVSWALGYSPDRPGGVPSRRGSTFGMVGANGSAAYADIDSGLAVAVMRNGPAAGGLAAAARIDRLIAELEEHP